jgi:hypothetical protein
MGRTFAIKETPYGYRVATLETVIGYDGKARNYSHEWHAFTYKRLATAQKKLCCLLDDLMATGEKGLVLVGGVLRKDEYCGEIAEAHNA